MEVADWASTRDALHMYTQIVGKIRMAHSPLINHWWQVPLYVSARGLTTSTIPYGIEAFDIEFDFVDHQLVIRTSTGATARVSLEPTSVAEFYAQTLGTLAELGVQTHISARPNEVDPALPFARDTVRRPYDAEAVSLFWRQLVQADRVLHAFRSHFLGKVSPVHFFWGSFDLACTRFSGRTAPAHPGGAPNCPDWVMVEGYSHELSSCGFWPGGGMEGAFYSYAYPEPDGFADVPVGPTDAFYSTEYRQFLLPYESVRAVSDPDAAVMTFLRSTYAAAADTAGWDRAALETDPTRLDDCR
ncbi:DUF5996 family protein [Mycolicibacterium hodleri]|uniref:Ava_C0101 and related proteins n=1 Tax=Mycolicibacterium hodleri TaxID=49897 RepID=A0A502E8V5_9MYCO|nr:DUF5996 family protein [Mycolicibacterium hodleri]TPG33814.1 hypothetical protein EAH80_14905 [Mycolicibacterium hodleri]